MDIEKIGKYIAGKRKDIGLTQVQLAEKLGVSDKSVSKWERGVCLPDVSLYMDLCSVLGISLSEFLAGEDIEPENVAARSEDTIINVTKEGNKRSRKFKGLSMVLAAVAIILLIVLAWFMNKEGYFVNNYVKPYPEDSDAYRAANMMTPWENVLMYDYSAGSAFNVVSFKVYEYKDGKLLDIHNGAWGEIPGISDGGKAKGTLGLAFDTQNNVVKIICSNDYGGTYDEVQVFNDYQIPGIMRYKLPNSFTIEPGKEIPIAIYRMCEEGFLNPDISFEQAVSDPEKAFEGDDRDIIVAVSFDKS